MIVSLHAKFIVMGIWLASSLVAHAEFSNPQAIEELLSGKQMVAHACWWGFDPEDATSSVQSAIDSGARKVILDKMPSPWIVMPIHLVSNQELHLEEGVILQAKRGEFQGKGDCLLTASGVVPLTSRTVLFSFQGEGAI